MAKRTRRFPPKKLLIVTAALLFLLLAGFGLARVIDNEPKPGTTTTASDGSLNPATEAEKKEAESRKDEIVQEQQAQSQASGSGLKNVTVVITEASSSGVRGYVQGVFEEGGTCTATATQGSQTVTKTSSGFKNVSYTQCAPINWSLGPGNWTVNLSYKSAAASGSASRTVEVK